MKKARIAFYGINGTGLGHISRLLNIAREARELLHAMDVGADFRFLTTSEAPQVSWDFPVWKSPSKSVVATTDTDNREYAAAAQFLVTNMVAMMRPDIIVMDTMPQGSFGEFLQLRSFCRKAAFINRHKSEAQAGDPIHLSHLPLYDLILTPDSAGEAARYVLPDDIRKRNVFTGQVHGVRAEELLGRAEVRAHFGVAPEQAVVYVSAGGGGDRHAVQEMTTLVDELGSDPSLVVLAGYGPLFRGKKRYGTNIIPLADPDVRHYFGGVDLAFCAAGYNTYEELLAAGVPTAFYAQVKGMDAQEERILIGASRGWNLHLEDFDPLSIRETAARLRTPSVRDGIIQALQGRGVSHGALRSAVELLRLHASLPNSAVQADALFAAAALRAAWGPVATERRLPPEASRARFVDAARAALRLLGQRPAVERSAFLDETRMAVLGGQTGGSAREMIAAGLEIFRTRAETGCSQRVVDSALHAFALSAPVETLAHPSGVEAFRRLCREQMPSPFTGSPP